MLARGPVLVPDALAAGRAVPASTVYPVESVRAVRRTHLPVLAGGLPNAADDIRVLQREGIDAMAEVDAEEPGVLSGAGSAPSPQRKDDR
jgi:hypothetical protein